MKAWVVRDEYGDRGSTVVFAETRGKAHYLAMHTDVAEDSEWCDISVRRIPEMDARYTPGKIEMDWYDAEDRIALVKLGWYCFEFEYAIECCRSCPAAQWCDRYQDYLKEVSTDDGL